MIIDMQEVYENGYKWVGDRTASEKEKVESYKRQLLSKDSIWKKFIRYFKEVK